MDENILKKCNYFSLNKRFNNRYYILNKNINCFSIINIIFFEKYLVSKNNRFSNGELFPEINGFSYALTSFGSFKGFIPIEPYIPDISKKESLLEKLPLDLEDYTRNFELIIYNHHVTLLIIQINKKKQKVIY